MSVCRKIAVCLLALLICLATLAGCGEEKSIYSYDEPAGSTGSTPFTPEDVFLTLTDADEIRFSVAYTEVKTDGTVDYHESAVLEKEGEKVKVTLSDNDEESLYYYDLAAQLGYSKVDGKWVTTSVKEEVPDWSACLNLAFAIEGMSGRISWLFNSDTYQPYDHSTGRCEMKTEEMQAYFGSNWSVMKAYLMQSGHIYYLYFSTTDDVGTFAYKLTIEPQDMTVELPK